MLLLMLLLPVLAHARISIGIDLSSRKEDVKIIFKGREERPATESDIREYGLSLPDFKAWCFRQMEDSCWRLLPDTGCVRRDPISEQFAINKTIEPIMGFVLNLDSKPSILASHNLENNGSSTVEYVVNLERKVKTSVTHVADDTKNFNTYGEVTASVSWGLGNAAAKASVSYDHTWGTSETKSNESMVRSSSGIKVKVEPYSIMEARMTASHGSMDVEIVYDIYLSGSMKLANKLEVSSTPSLVYSEYSLDEFCESVGISNRFQVSEIMKVDFYSEYDTKLFTTPIEVPHYNPLRKISHIVEERKGYDILVVPSKQP